MEYTDFCIAQEKKRIAPLTTDAIYYVTADSRYRIFHRALDDSIVFISTLRGHGEILLGDRRFDLSAGDIFLFCPTAPFEYRCTDASWTFWWFEFRCIEPDFLALPLETVLSIPFNDTYLYLCREALESLKLKDSRTASCLLAALFCLLQKESNEIARPDGTLTLFQQADQYIHHNLATVTVSSTAAHLNISDRTLLNVFQSLLGISTSAYIQNTKMDMAQHLLTTGNNTIKEISDSLGYTDQFSFSKGFARHFGMSPREYRKQKGGLTRISSPAPPPGGTARPASPPYTPTAAHCAR